MDSSEKEAKLASPVQYRNPSPLPLFPFLFNGEGVFSGVGEISAQRERGFVEEKRENKKKRNKILL